MSWRNVKTEKGTSAAKKSVKKGFGFRSARRSAYQRAARVTAVFEAARATIASFDVERRTGSARLRALPCCSHDFKLVGNVKTKPTRHRKTMSKCNTAAKFFDAVKASPERERESVLEASWAIRSRSEETT